MSTYLDRLEQDLVSAARRRQRREGRGLRSVNVRLVLAAPVLATIAVVLFLILGANATVPTVNFSGNAENTSFVSPPTGSPSRFVGNPGCIRDSIARRLPALVHSNAAPTSALVSELSLLRTPSTSIDTTSLGHWDRDLPPIITIFTRYERVFDGPRNVRVAFVPVAYCNETQLSGPSLSNFAPATATTTTTTSDDVRVFRVTREEGLIMLVLSNPGVHPPVLVGTAQQIKQGPGLAGLDVSNGSGHETGWLQATIVPDGVSRVVMKFTPPFLHHYTNSVAISSNVGIVVRNPPYTPTTVLWYGPSGTLIKRFVDRQTLAYENCLHAHDCPKPHIS
jgi:hypothetical protein